MLHSTSIHTTPDTEFSSTCWPPVDPGGPNWGTIDIGTEGDEGAVSIFFKSAEQLSEFIDAAIQLRAELEAE